MTEKDRINEVWEREAAKWKRSHRSASYQTGQWIDLAKKEFEIRCEGKTEEPYFEEEAPLAVRYILATWALKWATSGGGRGTRRRRR